MTTASRFRPVLNPHFLGFACIRHPGEHVFAWDSPVADDGLGCPLCLAEGLPASVSLRYDDNKLDFSVIARDNPGFGSRHYAPLLAYSGAPSRGEGNTPLVELASLAGQSGVRRLHLMHFGAEPTGSHKDLMTPQAVARAIALGRKVVTCASSGNAGVSMVTYAAAAGLEAVIFATPRMNALWGAHIRSGGARMVVCQSANERWVRMGEMVKRGEAYPLTNFLKPPVGSNPFGVEGYATAAWRSLRQLAIADGASSGALRVPDWVIVPTARGDLLWGMWHGFVRAHAAGLITSLPRMVAAEPLERLEAILVQGADYRQSFQGPPHSMSSIGGETATLQSELALRQSNGLAVTVSNADALAAFELLCRHEGMFLEVSSAAALAAFRLLRERAVIGPDATVLLAGTSHGYKEPPGVDVPLATLA
jgi:threonine synthase